MKRETFAIIIGCAALLPNIGTRGATLDATTEVAFRVHLTDKAGSQYCALSDRAMQRRERLGIALDSTDLEVSTQYQTAIRALGWQIVSRSRWLNTVVVKANSEEPLSNEELSLKINNLQEQSFVRQVEQVTDPSDLQLGAAALRGTEEKVRDKWRMEKAIVKHEPEVDTFRNPIREVHGEVLGRSGWRGAGMLIAVLDGGFTRADNCAPLTSKIVGWHDPYCPADTEGERLFGSSDHGTNVLSILACDTSYGVWGTAPDAQYFLIRTEEVAVECPVEEDMWVAGAEMADSLGADVINSSLCYMYFDNPMFDHTWEQLGQNEAFVSQGARIAAGKGMLICCSAGNERENPWQKIGFPSDCPELLTVGGTDPWGEASYFTSVGWVHGDDVKPNLSARATGAWHYDAWFDRPTQGNGTSYSCPAICGLMASLWCTNPSLSPDSLRAIVCRTCSQYVLPDSLIGYGLPNFEQALREVDSTLSAIDDLHAEAAPTRGAFVLKQSENGSFIVQNRKKTFVFRR
jgi:subtilisin family serine protease